MPTYRLYWIGSDDHIRKAENVECASDTEACELAQERIGDYLKVEVWLGATCVGRRTYMTTSCTAPSRES
jgi:hypothetical protein